MKTKSPISGMILGEDGLFPGRIHFEERRIVEVEEVGRSLRGRSADIVVMPMLVNAHTHMGDAFVTSVPRGLSVKALVGPPNGLKHRLLRTTDELTKGTAMVTYLRTASELGTRRILDFREEGVQGSQLGRTAETVTSLFAEVRTTILGRPGPGSAPAAVLRFADGLSISSISDIEFATARSFRRSASTAGKPFALHASEARREPMDRILALRPDLLVHLCQATTRDLEAVADARIPVAVCPRANAYFGLRPPVKQMLDLGIRVCAGTDNAMLATPDLFAEARALMHRRFGGLRPLDALRVAVLNAQRLLSRGPEGLAKGAPFPIFRLPLRRPSLARVLKSACA